MAGTAQPNQDLTGTTLDGKYQLEGEVASGGMGVVVAARHLITGGRVAIKLIKGDIGNRPDIVQRVLREARATARLRGEHIVRVLDAGMQDNGAPYLVLEMLVGEDLNSVLRRTGPLPQRRVAEIVRDACKGLAEAHAAGIVHRDLKPSNLFLAEEPNGDTKVKVLDFGISKLESAEETLTVPEVVLGSPAYMAPEQMVSAHGADHLADIWSMGAIVFRLVSGKYPYDAKSTADMMAAVMGGKPRSLKILMPEIDPELESVVSKCMEFDPRLRFQSAEELGRALERYVASASAEVRAERTLLELNRGDTSSGRLPGGEASSQSERTPGATPPPSLPQNTLQGGISFNADPASAPPPVPRDPRLSRSVLLVLLGAMGVAAVVSVTLLVVTLRGPAVPATASMPVVAASISVPAAAPTSLVLLSVAAPSNASEAPVASSPSAQPSASASAAPKALGGRRDPFDSRL